MGLYITKILISAIIIVAVTESSKFSNLWASLIASLPLVSIISIAWVYIESKEISRVSDLSYGILWVIIPSLVFFVLLPMFLKFGINFWVSLIGSCALTGLTYLVYLKILEKLGISI